MTQSSLPAMFEVAAHIKAYFNHELDMTKYNPIQNAPLIHTNQIQEHLIDAFGDEVKQHAEALNRDIKTILNDWIDCKYIKCIAADTYKLMMRIPGNAPRLKNNMKDEKKDEQELENATPTNVWDQLAVIDVWLRKGVISFGTMRSITKHYFSDDVTEEEKKFLEQRYFKKLD